jgi:transposase
VDALGNPIHVHLTPGNCADVSEAPRLIEAATGSNFIADKGYDSSAVVTAIEAKGMTAVIPSTSTRSIRRRIDRHVYKERHLVENFFSADSNIFAASRPATTRPPAISSASCFSPQFASGWPDFEDRT